MFDTPKRDLCRSSYPHGVRGEEPEVRARTRFQPNQASQYARAMDAENAPKRAELLVDAGRPKAALKSIAPYLAENPDDAIALRVVAYAKNAQGKFAAALAAAQSAIAADPTDSWAWQLIAQAQTGTGDFANARLSARECRRLAPRDAAANSQVAVTDVATGLVTAESLEAAKAGIRLAPDDPGAHLALGNVHLEQNNLRAAYEAFFIGLSLDPQNDALRNNLALVGLRMRTSADTAANISTQPIDEANWSPLTAAGTVLARIHAVFAAQVVLGYAAITVYARHPGGWLDVAFRPTLAVLVLATAVVAVVLIRKTLTAAGVQFRELVLQVWRFDRTLTVWAVFLLSGFALTAVAPFVPVLFGELSYVLAAGVVLWGSIIWFLRRRNSANGQRPT
jgi:tetratricopeptide (TPR) repeat protein